MTLLVSFFHEYFVKRKIVKSWSKEIELFFQNAFNYKTFSIFFLKNKNEIHIVHTVFNSLGSPVISFLLIFTLYEFPTTTNIFPIYKSIFIDFPRRFSQRKSKLNVDLKDSLFHL